MLSEFYFANQQIRQSNYHFYNFIGIFWLLLIVLIFTGFLLFLCNKPSTERCIHVWKCSASISDFIVFLVLHICSYSLKIMTLGGSCYVFYVGLNTVSYYYVCRLWIGLTQSYILKAMARSILYHKPWTCPIFLVLLVP